MEVAALAWALENFAYAPIKMMTFSPTVSPIAFAIGFSAAALLYFTRLMNWLASPKYLRQGLKVCRRLRAVSHVPVIMLKARGRGEEVIEGFDVGAHDYPAKPFGAGVLLAPVKAVLRRYRTEVEVAVDHCIEWKDLVVDFSARRVTRGGQPIHLTRTEFPLLTLLTQYHSPSTVGKSSLHQWSLPKYGGQNMPMSLKFRASAMCACPKRSHRTLGVPPLFYLSQG